MARWPFTIDAMVLLPDHIHAIWTLPREDANYARRWGWIKKEFAKAWIESGGP
jgi:putative transposase